MRCYDTVQKTAPDVGIGQQSGRLGHRRWNGRLENEMDGWYWQTGDLSDLGDARKWAPTSVARCTAVKYSVHYARVDPVKGQ